MNTLKRYWEEKPLLSLLVLGLIIRCVAAIFSKGWGMHDDHFLIIEAAQSWVDGYDYNKWLSSSSDIPSGHSFFYTGLHYYLFSFLKAIGIDNPQTKMYVVRFLHALYSLFIIYFGYRIAKRAASEKVAKIIGLLLALMWLFPYLSVHNLVEYVCIPPLLWATWLLYKNEEINKRTIYLIAGLVAGLAMGIRFQSILFIFGFFAVLLIRKRILGGFIFGIGVFLSFFITQIADLFNWGYPFAELIEYIDYNLANSSSYFDRPWYMYFFTISGLLIFPVSIFLLFGFVKGWKKYLILFLPAALFLVFHSYFPNKQERFILPVLPFIIILGYIMWHSFKSSSSFWNKHARLYRICWIFFWLVNSVLLVFASTAYTKKSRVEAMTYLSEQDDFRNFIWECTHRDGYLLAPQFYLNQWDGYAWTTSSRPVSSVVESYEAYNRPNYVVFVEEDNLTERMKTLKKYFPELEYKTTIEPGFLDKFLHALNPNNTYERYFIYKINSTDF